MNRTRIKVGTPPAFFNRGPSAATRLLFFSLLSLAAMVADYRFSYLVSLRQLVSTVLYPFEQAVLSPVTAYQTMATYLVNQSQLLKENAELKIRLINQSAEAQRAEAIQAEYSHLRTLINAADRLNTKGVVAEV